MRKLLEEATDEDIRSATCVVLCNVGHSKALPVAGENALPDRLAFGGSVAKPQTLFIVIRSETEFDEAMALLRRLRPDVRAVDWMARKTFVAGR